MQGKGPEGLKTEAASSSGFGSRTPVSVIGLPGAPSQSQFSPEGLKEEAHLLTSRTALSWDFPGSPVIKIWIPVQGTWVQSLVGELRSHMANKKKEKKKKKNGPFLPHENLLTGQGTTLPRPPQVPGPEVGLSVSPASL